MTAYGFVEYVAVLKEWNDRERAPREVRRVLDLVGLADLATKKIREALRWPAPPGRASPRRCSASRGCCVLDEPTTGLDPSQRADLRRTLSVIGAECAVLLSTHQTEDVAALCERVVVLAGRRGPLRRPRHRARRHRRRPGLARRRARPGRPASAGAPAPAATTSSAVRRRRAPMPPNPRSRTPTCSCSARDAARPLPRLTRPQPPPTRSLMTSLSLPSELRRRVTGHRAMAAIEAKPPRPAPACSSSASPSPSASSG